MQADMYHYSSKSINLKQNEAICIVIHDLESRVCERSLRGYLCCHVTSMEARRGQHFSYSSICQFTQWCALETHNRTNHREKDKQWSLLSHLHVVVAELWVDDDPYCFTPHRQARSPILNDTNRLGNFPKNTPSHGKTRCDFGDILMAGGLRRDASWEQSQKKGNPPPDVARIISK